MMNRIKMNILWPIGTTCASCPCVQVRLYRNGDAHFAGRNYPVSAERHRTLDALLEDLTQSIVCDRTVLPQGVRYLFVADTGRRVTTLKQLEDGASYVCSTRPLYKRLDYTQIGSVISSRSHHQVGVCTLNYKHGREGILIFYRATYCICAVFARDTVCLSVELIDRVKTSKHRLQSNVSPPIIYISHQILLRNSDMLTIRQLGVRLSRRATYNIPAQRF